MYLPQFLLQVKRLFMFATRYCIHRIVTCDWLISRSANPTRRIVPPKRLMCIRLSCKRNYGKYITMILFHVYTLTFVKKYGKLNGLPEKLEDYIFSLFIDLSVVDSVDIFFTIQYIMVHKFTVWVNSPKIPKQSHKTCQIARSSCPDRDTFCRHLFTNTKLHQLIENLVHTELFYEKKV